MSRSPVGGPAPDPEAELARERHQARWLRYLREAEKANFHGASLHEDCSKLGALSGLPNPTISMPRELLLRIRANYWTMLVVSAELLGTTPEAMTVGHAFFAMVRRYDALREDDDDELPEPPTDGRTSRHAVGDRVEQLGGPGEVPVGTLGRVDAFSEVGEDLYLVNWDGIGSRWWPSRYVGRTSSEGGQR